MLGAWKGEGKQGINKPKQTLFHTLFFKTDIRACLSCAQGFFHVFYF